MHAYEMDDEPTYYAAKSAEEATQIYTEDSGEPVEDGYPRMLTDAELDAPRADYDENERPTGETTSIRYWLAETTAPGFLAGRM